MVMQLFKKKNIQTFILRKREVFIISLSLNDQQRKNILLKIKDHIEKEGNCRVGWAINQIMKQKKYEESIHIIEKIANTIIQSGEYIKEPSLQVKNDFNILKNPQYRLTQINKRTVIINTIIAILTLLSMIISILFTSKAKEISEQRSERQMDYVSKKVDKTNFAIDSLVNASIDTVHLNKLIL
jgi:hypothetical protein